MAAVFGLAYYLPLANPRVTEAILEASCQLEAFDGISCPCDQGIFTHDPAATLEPAAQYCF